MRKRGKTINHTLTLRPLGAKDRKYELEAHSALLALNANVHNQDHLVSLWVLSDICQRTIQERYIKHHADTVRRLCESINQAGKCSRVDYVPLETSANLLIEFFKGQKNSKIAEATLQAVNELGEPSPCLQ